VDQHTTIILLVWNKRNMLIYYYKGVPWKFRQDSFHCTRCIRPFFMLRSKYGKPLINENTRAMIDIICSQTSYFIVIKTQQLQYILNWKCYESVTSHWKGNQITIKVQPMK